MLFNVLLDWKVVISRNIYWSEFILLSQIWACFDLHKMFVWVSHAYACVHVDQKWAPWKLQSQEKISLSLSSPYFFKDNIQLSVNIILILNWIYFWGVQSQCDLLWCLFFCIRVKTIADLGDRGTRIKWPESVIISHGEQDHGPIMSI